MKVAVESVSFGLPKGQVFGLLGPNGAGKTTTMKMIIAEENPTQGNIKIGQHDIISNNSPGFEQLGYCPQVRKIVLVTKLGKVFKFTFQNSLMQFGGKLPFESI